MGTNSDPTLVDYGIQNEQSDIRAHVCPIVRRVYVYPTSEGRKAIESGDWPKRPGYQTGVVGATAEGFLVPPFSIRRCVSVGTRPEAWVFIAFDEGEDTTAKGAKAVRFVADMIRTGVFPLPYPVGALNDDPALYMQIEGDDIIMDLGAGRVRIQVKCDFRGGEKELGGTGNLFLQVAERNPLKKK